jgi:hypothetical protein
MQKESDLILGTCEICFKVFMKPSGVPCQESSVWVCSYTCRASYKPKVSQDSVLEQHFDSNLKRQAEADYQHSIHKQGEDVDLDFNY